MKKVLFLQIASSAALLTLFNGCSGGSNNLPPLAPQAGMTVGLGCSGGAGINSETSSQACELTGDKRTQYEKHCTQLGGYSELCHFQLKGVEAFSVDVSENGELPGGSVLPILTPGSQTDGLPTGIIVYPGDLLTISVVDGHYSTHSSFGHCSNDIDGEGNQDIRGEGGLISNAENGMQAGAYLEFVDPSGVRSGFQAIGRKAARISIPTTGSQSNPLSVLIGYNAASLSCGDIKVSYQIRRCLDTALNTYDCSKL